MGKFDYNFALNVFQEIVKTIPITLCIVVLSLVLAIVIAILLVLIEHFDIRFLSTFSRVYTSFFRGTPLLVQLFFFYFGIPNFILPLRGMSGFTACIIGLGLNTSAYMKEILRGAIISVDKGQFEAGYSLGMTRIKVFIHIVFPQAVRVAIPALSNCVIDTVKGSSLAFTVGVIELTAVAQLEASRTFSYFEAYAALLILYWIIGIIIEKILKVVEIRLGKYEN